MLSLTTYQKVVTVNIFYKMKKVRKEKNYHHGNLKKAVITRALEIISQKGIDGLSLREVARALGTSHAAPYRHFKDKNELLAAIAEDGLQRMLAQMKGKFRNKNAIQKLREIGAVYVQFGAKNPYQFRVMFARELANRALYPALQQASRNTMKMLEEVVKEGQNSKLIIPGNSRDIAVMLWSSVHGVTELFINNQMPKNYTANLLAKLLVSLTWDGFRI